MISNLQLCFAVVFLYSAFFTYASGYYLVRKFKAKKFTVIDIYKKNKPKIANLGGITGLLGIITSVIIFQLIIKEYSKYDILIFNFIVIEHAFFGLVDDLIFISNRIKIIAPYFLAFPVLLLVKETTLSFFGWELPLGILFLYVVAPVYLMVVTNLINMHSGFNGLASGVSLSLCLALSLRTILRGDILHLFFILPILGALVSLHYYDKYPARMIWGNVGSMMIGSAIGAYILVSNAEWFGIVILMPHIIDFGLYLISVIIRRKNFDNIKFGTLREDGTIKVPTRLKLKFLFPYYFRLTEKQTTWIMYGITGLFCVIGLVSGL